MNKKDEIFPIALVVASSRSRMHQVSDYCHLHFISGEPISIAILSIFLSYYHVKKNLKTNNCFC